MASAGRQARAERRAAARRAKLAAIEPRKDERRQERRRADPPLEGEALERRLRELGIGQDRRRAPGDRRDGGDRRRR
jgi:hypothetical protein